MINTAQILNIFVQRAGLMHNHSAYFLLIAQNICDFVQHVFVMHTNRVILNHLAQMVFNFVQFKKLHLCN
jgi:hypothetical protein